MKLSANSLTRCTFVKIGLDLENWSSYTTLHYITQHNITQLNPSEPNKLTTIGFSGWSSFSDGIK